MESQLHLDLPLVKKFLLTSEDDPKLQATLQALNTIMIRHTQHEKLVAAAFTPTYDLLGLIATNSESDCVVEHLLRHSSKVIRCQTFELVASVAATKQGRRYLLQRKELVSQLIEYLLETPAEGAAESKALMASEVMEHRWLLFALFRLSQSKMSI